MNKIEKEIYETLYKNALIFLKDGIERLVSKDDKSTDSIEYDLLILTCTSIQISMELAVKALIVKKRGLKYILNKSHQNQSFDEIYELFKENKIKTQEFDNSKNFVKSENLVSDFNKDDFKIISDFQNLRNGFVHFSYNILVGDFYDLKYDIINYFIHTLTKILSEDLKPSEFYDYKLGKKYKKLLLSYPPYISAMTRLAHRNSEKVFKCIICNNHTYSKEEDYCYCCNFYGDSHEFVDCDYCKEENSIIFDYLNIKFNNNEAKGLCLNCGKDWVIFKCPKCDSSHNIETALDEKCTNSQCNYID